MKIEESTQTLLNLCVDGAVWISKNAETSKMILKHTFGYHVLILCYGKVCEAGQDVQ